MGIGKIGLFWISILVSQIAGESLVRSFAFSRASAESLVSRGGFDKCFLFGDLLSVFMSKVPEGWLITQVNCSDRVIVPRVFLEFPSFESLGLPEVCSRIFDIINTSSSSRSKVLSFCDPLNSVFSPRQLELFSSSFGAMNIESLLIQNVSRYFDRNVTANSVTRQSDHLLKMSSGDFKLWLIEDSLQVSLAKCSRDTFLDLAIFSHRPAFYLQVPFTRLNVNGTALLPAEQHVELNANILFNTMSATPSELIKVLENINLADLCSAIETHYVDLARGEKLGRCPSCSCIATTGFRSVEFLKNREGWIVQSLKCGTDKYFHFPGFPIPLHIKQIAQKIGGIIESLPEGRRCDALRPEVSGFSFDRLCNSLRSSSF